MKWIKNRRKKLVQEIALEVVNQLDNKRGWEKFLPPVQLRDAIYMVTENGSIYRMNYNLADEFEIITQIRRG